jgi:DNA-binding NarL/FixJ family response regulator
MDALKLLLADDHPLFRAALRQVLNGLAPRVEIVEAATFSALAATIAATAELDLVLLDLTMPGAMGLSALVYLRGERPEVPVLVVSADDHPRTVRRTQQFGAAGFVSKSASPQEMQAAVQAVMDGGEWFQALEAARSDADAQLARKLAQLTPQQLRVLMHLADGLLNKQIAYELGTAENTIKQHVTALLRKLECNSRTQLAVLVKGLVQAAPLLDEGGSGGGAEQ